MAESLTGKIGNDGKPWPRTMDAAVWAAEFIEHCNQREAIAGDEGVMVGWFANAIMAGFDEAKRQCSDAGHLRENELSASEALFGFGGWLSTRPEVLQVGGHFECPPVVDVIKRFIDANRLPPPRDGWDERLTHPSR
jgi:hypothetical protein